MTGPPPLPRPVPFPVYGLDAVFTGTRTLVLWNLPDYLWTVTLTHSYPASTAHVTVTTTRKKPATSGGDEGPAAPMSLADAAHDAIVTAVDLSRAHTIDARATWRREADRVDIVDGELVLHDWTPTPLVVDGTPTPAYERRIGIVRAVVVDLPDVVLSITGPPDRVAPTLHLVDVREHLDDYPWPSN